MLVRALHFPFWNGQFATKSAFEKMDVSVSSLGLLTQTEILAILKHDLEQVAAHPVKIEALATISAGKVREICKEPAEKLTATVDVVHAPIQDNPPWADNAAHCEIRARGAQTLIARTLSAGMAKAIVNHCEVVKL